MWAPRQPEPPAPGWWTELETAEQWETRRWVDGIAAKLRAERIERLRARVHEVDMRAAGALARDQWERIQRRRDRQSAVRHQGDAGRLVGCQTRDRAFGLR